MFVRIARTVELVPGFRRLVRHGRHDILALEDQGEVFLIDNRCPHQGFPLDRGAQQGRHLTCPRHGFRFSLENGSCSQGNSCQLVRYVPRYDGQWLGVELPD